MTHITIERKALQTVLDTLEENHHLIEQYERSEYLALYDRQITVIKKALAAPVQPVQEHKNCALCGEGEPFTGACGGGRNNPKALCYTPPAAPVQEGRDWSLLEATQESLREHMVEIKRLKAAQPAVPLTDEQIDAAIKSAKKVDTGYAGWVRDQRREFGRAIEAAHGIAKGQP
jgi:hypothetical protein